MITYCPILGIIIHSNSFKKGEKLVSCSLFDDTSKVVHMVGIGGVSMSGLAEVLNFKGFVIQGSDNSEGEHIARLRKLGMKISIGHDGKNVDGADFLIRTSAISDENPEIIRARELGIPVIERAEAWGCLMQDYENVLCISGTHGKTTTTAMSTHIAIEARRDPQVMVGANVPIIGGNLRVASGDLFIAEACEYCNSFLSFSPTFAVILNVEEDHLDFFSGIDDIIASFRKFADKVPENGAVVYNADDENVCRVVDGLNKKCVGFGIKNGDVKALRVQNSAEGLTFTLARDGEELVEIKLPVGGMHNVYNALAATTAALELGISPKCIASALSKFTGAARRFELKGSLNGASVYDDYAHHPSEVRATLSAARARGEKRIICAFQPHTYTRTKALSSEFAKALSLADVVYVAKIYAAREKPIDGVTSELITSKMENAKYIPEMRDIVTEIKKTACEGDIIFSMGAGDIFKVSNMLCE